MPKKLDGAYPDVYNEHDVTGFPLSHVSLRGGAGGGGPITRLHARCARHE